MKKGQIGVQELIFAGLFLVAGVGIFMFSSGMLGGLGEMGGGFWGRLSNATAGTEAWSLDPLVNGSVTAIGEMFQRAADSGRTISPESVCKKMDGHLSFAGDCPEEKVKVYLFGGRVCCG